MLTDEKNTIMQILERFARTGSATDEQVRVTCLPQGKTSFVERSGEDDRSILLDEYQVGGRVIWAAYSGRTETVYLSAAA